MPISKTNQVTPFPAWATAQESASTRYAPLPTPALMKTRSLFGIPLRSYLTGETVTDAALQNYISEAVSEVEHTLDLYITPVTFEERQDYSGEMQMFSFGYIKLNHAPILNVESFQLSFNNGAPAGAPLVSIPLEFVHIQPMEGTLQLVPAQGVTMSGFIASVYSGLGYHAFSAGTISNWPGAMVVKYTCGFPDNMIPAIISGLIENLAAFRFLSSLGPVLFPHNSTSISIDGTSQSVGTLGPAYLQNRLADLEKIIQAQMEAVKGYYQKRFLVDYI